MHTKNTTDENMSHKRIDITLLQDDIDKLDRICKKRGYTQKSKKKKDKGKTISNRSSMIARIIQEYKE